MTIPDDIMQIAQEVVDRIAKVHVLKGDCVEDVANAISAEREHFRQLLSQAQKREREARPGWAFAEGDMVRKKSGSWWEGRVVGTYSTEQTPRGYAVQLDKPFGPVQIYPESALESALQSEER